MILCDNIFFTFSFFFCFVFPNGTESDAFRLFQLVVRLMLGHPHHTGYSLLSLVNADLDESPTVDSPAPRTSRPKRQKLDSLSVPVVAPEKDTRQAIAAELFSELCHSQSGPVFLQMKKLAVALIEFANVDVEKQRGSTGTCHSCLCRNFFFSYFQENGHYLRGSFSSAVYLLTLNLHINLPARLIKLSFRFQMHDFVHLLSCVRRVVTLHLFTTAYSDPYLLNSLVCDR
ncbi:unnamed protein product [Dibothriocephalus latus]|uniref:Uncharacterized protein n=1 Tax=Dibothriocephalus latus TaxID=60516 RepID=A0A3P7MGB0_DIBLA|nr:unnamed protein product [Dibothriocephalus latus]